MDHLIFGFAIVVVRAVEVAHAANFGVLPVFVYHPVIIILVQCGSFFIQLGNLLG